MADLRREVFHDWRRTFSIRGSNTASAVCFTLHLEDKPETVSMMLELIRLQRRMQFPFLVTLPIAPHDVFDLILKNAFFKTCGGR